MTAVKFDDAAFRYTESGQEVLHYLGAKLRQPTQNPVQTIYEHTSADLTTIRRIAIGNALYDLTAQIRYDGNPQQLADFIAAARRGASLEYFPSLASPSLSFPCELIAAGEIQPDQDFWHQRRYTCDVRLRRTDGGTWQALVEEPLFYFKAGNDPSGLTFTRSGAVGKHTDDQGVLQDAAANIWRTDWSFEDGGVFPDTPWLLLESPAFTNLVTDDGITAGTGWSSTGTPVITGGVDDPAGGTDAYTVEDDDGAAVEDRYFTTAAVSGTGAKCVVFIVRENTMPASGAQVLYVLSSTDGTVGYVQITAWSGGEPTASATTGTLLGKRYVGNGYWALYVQTASVTSAATLDYGIRPAETAAQTGSIDVHRINGYDGPTPPWSILDASEVKNAETFYADFTHAPQAMCGMVDFRELEDPTWTTDGGDSRRIIYIGSAADGNPRFLLQRTSGGDTYNVFHIDSAGTQTTTSIDINPSWGDRVQLFWWLYADGSVNIAGRRQALGSSTWSSITTGSASTALDLPNDGAWSDTRLYLGSVGASGRGSQLYHTVKIHPGSDLTTAGLLAL